MEQELYHWGIKLGGKREKHKYYDRINLGSESKPNYRYFYTKSEFDKFMSSSKRNVKSFGKTVINTFNNVSNSAKQYILNKSNQNQQSSKFDRSAISKIINKTVKDRTKEDRHAVIKNAKDFIEKAVVSKVSKASNAVKEKISNISKAKQDFKDRVVNKTIGSINTSKKNVLKSLDYKNTSFLINKAKSLIFSKSILNKENNKNNDTSNSEKSFDEKTQKVIDSWNKEVEKMMKQVNKKNPSSFSEVKKKSREMTEDEDMKRVNPYYLEDDSFKINCVYCTLAYRMRRKGYDVEADDYHQGLEEKETANTFVTEYGFYTHNNVKNDFAKRAKSFMASLTNDTYSEKKYANEMAYPGTTFEYSGKSDSSFTSEQIKKIEKDILSQGEGASGSFILKWTKGGGHSVVYEVKDKKVILRDCQSGEVVNVDDYAKYAKTVIYFRTDNEELTDSALSAVKNKDEDTTNPGKKGKPKTTAYALADKYDQMGYKVYTTVIDGEVLYKVYLSDDECLYIDKNCNIDLGNSNRH